jgi:hypothetical protein
VTALLALLIPAFFPAIYKQFHVEATLSNCNTPQAYAHQSMTHAVAKVHGCTCGKSE